MKMNDLHTLPRGMMAAILVAISCLAATLTATATTESYQNVRGKTMAQVKALLGEPLSVKGPVGGFNDKRPPITEWQYDGFFITFENNIALHGNEKGSLKLELSR